MTPVQIDTFLKAPRHAIVGTNRADGAPHLSPVWYIYQDGLLYISIGVDTAKLRNLRRDPRISVCVDGGHPDARAVMIYGTSELLEGDDPSLADTRWRIVRHYYDSDDAASRYLDSIRDYAFVIVVVTPEQIISQDFNG
jgi:PPOX class probable F420-dependent enzyme